MQHQQHMAALILGLCLAAACHGGVAMSVSSKARAESQASTWLRAHSQSPQQDELAELKAENPSAYAIVKALLTKRSLGLLDPKHPTASFAPGQSSRPAEDEPVPQGAEAFERIAEESGDKPKPHVALAYPDVDAAPAHQDWLNWKPAQSAVDDDAMVKNVLGAVAELKAGNGVSANLRGQGQSDSGSDGSDALQWKDATAAVSVAPAAPAAPVSPSAPAAPVDVDTKPQAAMSQENSYLKGIDFGFDAQPARAPQPEANQENTYLKGISFGSNGAAAAPTQAAAAAVPAHMAQLGLHAATAKADSHDYLASFSWDDDAPSRTAPPVAATSAPMSAAGTEPAKAPAAKASAGGNALLAWLGGGAPAAAAAAPKVAKAPALQQNSYMMDLQ